jgi:hypothetical protein
MIAYIFNILPSLKRRRFFFFLLLYHSSQYECVLQSFTIEFSFLFYHERFPLFRYLCPICIHPYMHAQFRQTYTHNIERMQCIPNKLSPVLYTTNTDSINFLQYIYSLKIGNFFDYCIVKFYGEMILILNTHINMKLLYIDIIYLFIWMCIK